MGTALSTLRTQLPVAAGTILASRWSNTTLDRAINDAILAAKPVNGRGWFTYGSDATQVIVKDTFEYTVPAACDELLWVEVEGTTSEPYGWTEAEFVYISSTKKIRLVSNNSFTAGKYIRIHYITYPDELSAADDETDVDVLWIQYYGLFRLWAITLADGGTEFTNVAAALVPLYKEMAEDYRNQYGMVVPVRSQAITNPTYYGSANR